MPGEEALLALLPMITDGLSSFGAMKEGQGQAKLASFNALVSEQRAKAIQAASDWSISTINRRKAKFLSTQQSLYAKAGVRMEGSVIDGMVESATEFEMDKIAERYNSQIEVLAARTEANNSRWQADNYRREGNFKAGMTILSSASKAGMMAAYSGIGNQPTKTLPDNSGQALKSWTYTGGKL